MCADRYFSERELGDAPRTREELSPEFWRGFVALFRRLLANGSLAEAFPDECFEAPYPVDVDMESLGYALQAEVPGAPWPLEAEPLPPGLAILDTIEFVGRHVSQVTARGHHSYGRHDHFYAFDREVGFHEYRQSVNRLLRRCQHPYELREDGQVARLVGDVAHEVLGTDLRTGDEELDRLLDQAVREFLDPDPEARQAALEHLWDAWERLKTLPEAPDKRRAAEALLARAVDSEPLRERIDGEAQALTDIGNEFRIRHSETDRHRVGDDRDIDYLFVRLYALIRRLVLGSQGPA